MKTNNQENLSQSESVSGEAANNELRQKQRAFLEDTAKFYNLGNRAMGKNGLCCYSKTDTSPGCGIGRHLSPELAAKLDLGTDYDWRNTMGDIHKGKAFTVDHEVVFEKLPNNLKELELQFLARLQRLHDNIEYWDCDRIDDKGKKVVNKICEDFGLAPIYV